MPKKPQHLSLVGYAGGPTKPKYSLTLHNNSKHAPGGGGGGGGGGVGVVGGKHPQLAILRDGHQQRQHLKALRLTREAGGAEPSDYRRPTTLEEVLSEEVASVNAKDRSRPTAAGGDTPGNATKSMGEGGNGHEGAKSGSGNGLGGGVPSGVMRAQKNRLWYH